MDNMERQQNILNYLTDVHFGSVNEIAAKIFTSPATARRDLEKLAAKGYVKLVYGGAVISEYSNEPVPIHLRDGKNSADKEIIAKKAAQLIQDNSTIIFDSSSTVRRICKHLTHCKGLTIITNNLRVCEELKNSDITVYCTGGKLIPRRECFVGHFAEQFIQTIKADALFFSCQGLSENGDITDTSPEELALRKEMIKSSKKQYFLCDPSKIDKDYPFTLCNTSQITDIIFK